MKYLSHTLNCHTEMKGRRYCEKDARLKGVQTKEPDCSPPSQLDRFLALALQQVDEPLWPVFSICEPRALMLVRTLRGGVVGTRGACM